MKEKNKIKEGPEVGRTRDLTEFENINFHRNTIITREIPHRNIFNIYLYEKLRELHKTNLQLFPN